jgi:chorismate dehydratase
VVLIDPLAFDCTENFKPEDSHISSSQHPPLKVAASSYLNSAPLIWSFLHGSKRGEVEFVDAVPAQCADLLARAEVEAALVPVIEYQRISEVSLVSRVCVGAKKDVRSVVLVSRDSELENIRTVALDESSRTSATLVKVIFREFLQREPVWTTHSPELTKMLEKNDAALIIGDPAMTFPREGLKVWDMARLWRNHTGLGFVFAMWMVRDETATMARAIDFAGARDEGLALMNEIIEYYQPVLGLSRESLKHYLEENICFSLDDQLRDGLNLYFHLARKHRLLPEVKPLKTIEP